jgi:hypothetical protein
LRFVLTRYTLDCPYEGKRRTIMSLLNKILSGTNGLGDAALRRGVPVAAIATLVKNRPDLAPLLDGLLVATMMGISSEQDQLAGHQGMTDWQVHKLEQNQELLFELIEQLADAVSAESSGAGVAGSAAQVKERIRARPQEMRVPPPAPAPPREKPWGVQLLEGWAERIRAGNRRAMRRQAREKRLRAKAAQSVKPATSNA